MDNYIMDSDYGPDQMKMKVDFDPSKYDTPEAAAKAFYEALKPVVRAYGQNPDTELAINDPEWCAQQGYGRNWQVSWEAGPYEWGIVVSLSWLYNRSAGWFTEPYYSFDVCFTE